MTSRTAFDHLRERLWLQAFPGSITVPTSPAADAAVMKLISDATVDDIALAVNALVRETAAPHRKTDAQRQVHDLARSVGARGATNALPTAVRATDLRAPPLDHDNAAASVNEALA